MTLAMARGYRFAAVTCGVRPVPGRADLALLVSDRPAAAAGAFTQNRLAAAPVRLCRQRLPSADIRGIVVCAGNANACTGARGWADAQRMAQVAAEALGCAEEHILVCSTGVIGRPLPMERIEPGIRQAATRLEASLAALEQAAQAILTTDTRSKLASRSLATAAGPVHLTGLAKGAAMIGPNLATMLAFVLTDAALTPAELAEVVPPVAARTFNCVRVEGHTSTNDTFLVLANGAGPRLTPAERLAFTQALQEVCGELARAIAADAEGAQHLVCIEVAGLRNDQEARQVAVAVADSPLVKTAIFGGDPNWGRIVSAAGYAGVDFEEQHLSLWLDQFLLYHAGAPQDFDAAAVADHLRRQREVHLRLLFSLGQGCCTLWTCDLTYDYIRLNAEYTT